MAYVLGIDIGGTHTRAAVSRFTGPTWSRPEIVRLDTRSPAVPSVLHVAPNGALTVGDSTVDELSADGSRTARGFIQRIGDDVPLVVAGEACKPQTLAAVLATWVVERVLTLEGARPEHIVVTHPAVWGQYRKRLLHEALCEIGLANVTLLAKPVTAAENHSFHGFTGRTLGVLALGGTNFATSVVRRTQPAGFEVLSCREGVEPLGGGDFDETLAAHVRTAIARELGAGQPGDPRLRSALVGLREDCSRAKERLTTATETEIAVHLPQGPLRVRVTRAEFDQMIRPALQLAVDAMDRTIRSYGLRPEHLDGILLVGGSARIPLLAELTTARFPGQVTVDADPQFTVAAGAALAGGQILDLASRRRQQPDWSRQPAPIEYPVGGPPALPAKRPGRDEDERTEPPPRPPVNITPLELPKPRSAPRLVPGRSFKAF